MTPIKNMIEFVEAHEAGEEFQQRGLDGEWAHAAAASWGFSVIEDYIKEGRLRIKPKTITLYEYSPILSGVPEDLHRTEDQHRISFDYTGRIIRDAVITDE
ncbi:hypothetical protein IIB79_05225 [candidate division KSB1 bacterium]|nr:hypothetical protein [candidate division KSB1 bacterium]